MVKMKINKYALLHVIIILAIYTTPLWLNWKLIIVYALLNILQIKINNDEKINFNSNYF